MLSKLRPRCPHGCISHNIELSKIFESRTSGAPGPGFVTGFSVVFSNSKSRNAESYEIRQSWLTSELKNGSVGRVLDTQP